MDRWAIETFSSHLHHQPKVLPRVPRDKRDEAKAQRQVDAEALGQLLAGPIHGGFGEEKEKQFVVFFFKTSWKRRREEREK